MNKVVEFLNANPVKLIKIPENVQRTSAVLDNDQKAEDSPGGDSEGNKATAGKSLLENLPNFREVILCDFPKILRIYPGTLQLSIYFDIIFVKLPDGRTERKSYNGHAGKADPEKSLDVPIGNRGAGHALSALQ